MGVYRDYIGILIQGLRLMASELKIKFQGPCRVT